MSGARAEKGHRLLEVEVPADPDAVRQLRSRIAEVMTELRPVDRTDLMLLVSEIAASRIGADAEPISVAIHWQGPRLHARIAGGSHPLEVDPFVEALVERLTSEWTLEGEEARFEFEPRMAPGLEDIGERQLFDLSAAGNLQARELLFTRYLGFAQVLSRRFVKAGMSADDLEQVAAIGLIKALDRYDPEYGVLFTTFAARTIEGELKRYLRDRGWSVRVSRGLQEIGFEVRRAEATLSQRLGRQPSLEELSEEIDLDIAQVGEAMLARKSFAALSLDAPVGPDSQSRRRLDRLPVEHNRLGIASDWAYLSIISKQLSPRDREILRLRFFEDLSQSEIARRVGVSQMHVSRLLAKSLAELREAMDSGTED